MLRAFNAFQITTLFAGLPFLIHWLSGKPFEYSQSAFWVALVAYLILYGWHIFAMYDSFPTN